MWNCKLHSTTADRLIPVISVASLRRVRVSSSRTMLFWTPFSVYILEHPMIYLIYKVTKGSHISILSPKNFSMNWIMHHAIKAYTAMVVQRHALLIAAVQRGVHLASRSVPLPPPPPVGKVPGTLWRGSQVDPRAGLEIAEKRRIYFVHTRSRMPTIRSESTTLTEVSM
jgi:hypothetical protein